MRPQIWQTKRIWDAGLEFTMSAGFEQWLDAHDTSLAFTAPPEYVFFVGRMADGNVWIDYRPFDKPMGLATSDTQTLHLAARTHLWRLQNIVPEGQMSDDGYDRVYAPLHSSATGYINAHEVCTRADDGLLVVNTRYNCLVEPSRTHSFTPVWWPPYVGGPWPNDRCHLNGLAMRDGSAAFATTVSQSPDTDGWRLGRQTGGTVVDVASNEIAAAGLSMPHSPRWYRDRLWLGNAGSGQLGYIDLDSGRFEPVAFLPGFVRGLCFVDDYAIVGTSKPRHGDMYSGLALDGVLAAQRVSPLLGLFVVDLRSGDVCEYLVIEGAVRELFEIMPLPGVRRAKVLGFRDREAIDTVIPERLDPVDAPDVWSAPWS